MVTELVWLVLGGLAVGLLGRLAVPGSSPSPWFATLLCGLAGALGGGLLTELVLGRGHEGVSLVVAVAFAASAVSVYSVYRRARALP